MEEFVKITVELIDNEEEYELSRILSIIRNEDSRDYLNVTKVEYETPRKIIIFTDN